MPTFTLNSNQTPRYEKKNCQRGKKKELIFKDLKRCVRKPDGFLKDQRMFGCGSKILNSHTNETYLELLTYAELLRASEQEWGCGGATTLARLPKFSLSYRDLRTRTRVLIEVSFLATLFPY